MEFTLIFHSETRRVDNEEGGNDKGQRDSGGSSSSTETEGDGKEGKDKFKIQFASGVPINEERLTEPVTIDRESIYTRRIYIGVKGENFRDRQRHRKKDGGLLRGELIE